MIITPEFHLPELTRWKKSRLLDYASQVLQAQQQMMGKNGKNILHYTLQKKRQFIRMSHYPKGDRIDYTTGAQYFYHCHRENVESMEHGHFHCFMRYKNIPRRITPTLPADSQNQSPMTHLVAISMNQFGQPIRLFTVNRWVSSDIWYDAKHAPFFIKRYKMTLNDCPHWQILDSWVEGVIHLFAPQIEWLQRARDTNIAQQKIDNPDKNVYENREIEELSEISINLNTQIQWVIG
ncbi:MAG: hypothetical protein Q8M03_03170 [Legionella sp.]|nr:hypothetical protein [Legionella sp.]